MKTAVVIVSAFLCAAAGAAEPVVSGVMARQNWPWNGNVDILYTLSADEPCDIEVTATWQGQSAPVMLGCISGDIVNVNAGNSLIVWDPVAAGVQLPLTDFRVTVTPATLESRKYLMLNLYNGKVTYSAIEPDWKNRTAEFLGTNMVFRRISATTFKFGYPRSQVEAGFANNRSLERNATLSSDYYMAIFPITEAQCRIMSKATVSDEGYFRAPRGVSYDDLRGTVGNGVCWPETFHKVAEGSVVAVMRDIVRNSIPSGWTVDLPTAAQWENAARAGENGRLCYVEGSEFGATHSEMTNIVMNAGQWRPGEKLVPQIVNYDPNPWGVYDTIGCVYEFVLDWRLPKGPCNTTDVIDPTGIGTPAEGSVRQVRGGRCTADCGMINCLPGNSGQGYESSTDRAARLCIHLKPITKIAD